MHSANGITNNVSFHFCHFAIQNDASAAWAEYWGAEEAFQPAALTYRKLLSHLAFAANRKAAECVRVPVCVFACTFQCDCMFLPRVSVLIVFMHACMCAHVNIFIFMSACCACVFIGTYEWHRCNICSVCACANCVCVCLPVPHLSD